MAAIIAIYKKRSIKATIFLLLCICAIIFYSSNMYRITDPTHPAFSELDRIDMSLRLHFENVEAFYRVRQSWPNSKLGGILFKREDIPDPNPNFNRTFTILVWKHWEWLKKRHVFNFGSSRGYVLAGCSVRNCMFTGDDNMIETADAVVIHLQKGLIPYVEHRKLSQRWIFLNDESPKNAFSLSNTKWTIDDLDNVFNWSMTYRSDADVPVPYGRTVAFEEPLMTTLELSEIAALVPHWVDKRQKETDASATILMSNCGVKERNEFLQKLRKHLKVDVYGGCSDVTENKNRCPGHFTKDCEPISKYLFYLVLENSNCFQYLSEKIFYHAYAKGAIPIIWGPSREDCESLLPPNSYLYVDKDSNIELLAKDVAALADNEDLLLSMHMWRNNFEIVNEHGYFGTKSYHLCRLCEAMNYNEETERIYSKDDLKWFLDGSLICKK